MQPTPFHRSPDHAERHHDGEQQHQPVHEHLDHPGGLHGAPLATCTVQLKGKLTSSDISIKASAVNGAFDGSWVTDYNDSPKYSVTQSGVTYTLGYYLEPNSLGYSNPTFWVWKS